jgi:uncharacterized membrane protein SpoIIM required for sporulation
VDLYRRVASHLSTARSRYGDPATVDHLTRLTGRANAVVHGGRPRTWRGALRAATTTFPAAVWHLRRFVAVATGLFLAGAVPVAVWLAWSPAAAAAVAPPEVVQAYLDRDFADYYTSAPAAEFAATVFTNNVRVGILAFAAGIVWCLPTAFVLGLNGVNLGVAAGLFHAHDRAAAFWGLILPHGLLELTAVFVAGGTGLALGWALVAPGDRTRSDALREQAQRAVVVVLGLVGVFLVAGAIEGFVTGSSLPTWARVGIGVAAELAFLGWVVEGGRHAAARGLTGALGEREVTAVRRP